MYERARSIVLLLGRVAVGVVFVAHGWQKFAEIGIPANAKSFEGFGIPFANLVSPAVATLEVVGGIALIAGALLPLFGVLFALEMIGAIVFVHAGHGLFVTDGGYELVLALGAASLMIAFSGGGSFAVDSVLLRGARRRTREAVPEPVA